MLFNASVLVRDLEVPTLAAYVAERAEKFAWCDATRQFEFLVFHVLGTRRALEGDHLAALRCYRRSAECAPTVEMRLLAILDRCRLMREFGETMSAAEELDYALRLATQTNWETSDAHERSALSLLAQLLAPTDLVKARAVYNRYAAIKTPVSRLKLGAHNRRQYADDCYAEAQILRAEGEAKRAVMRLLEAFEVWSQIGYDRLRAMAACELAELTGELRFVRIAQREVRRYPNSSLARRMRGAFESPEEPLTAAI
ncbi:MAG: hypothetical protein NVS3B16_09490 [Vulcanimicrobiaceae bacterium]